MYSWKVKEPSINNLKAVADVLNVSVDYLLGKTDDNSTSKKPKHVDIADDDVIMTFEGKPIPPEDLELMKRLLRGGRNND
ncbi:XRE family transcriptional regulator [Lactiplantibacillus pentosus]|uniref:XRE family transcriptional regulator n=1 Tax=Lactiplantibacillus pentosus TaxID=1589 RepID=A0AAW8WBB6_LACPE|nr:XRE family transcriptional regulator [Lactiplantibacillus pentosus]MDT7038790.1 XRE family transcriptional regulator [Lactiplantibacillus pentosus]